MEQGLLRRVARQTFDHPVPAGRVRHQEIVDKALVGVLKRGFRKIADLVGETFEGLVRRN